MTSRKLKRPVVYGIYIGAVVLVLGAIYLIEGSLSKGTFKEDDNERPVYVSDTIFSEDIPVVGSDSKILRPYTDTEVTIVKNYYDYQGNAESQIESILYHENSGISYGGKDNFDVVAILDGKVVSVKEDSLLGKIVELEHSNGMISVYQSLSEVIVAEGDSITGGAKIGTSGTNNIAKDLGSHLDFELIIKGETVNPESYYDK